jgi:cellulose synthase operon protein C
VRIWLFQIVLSVGLLSALPSVAANESSYLDEAQHLQASGQLRAAEIELKNAVRSDQNNMTAHYRLAIVELQLGETAAAEHEASIARAGGFDPEKVVPVLLEAYLGQGKYKELLQDFPATTGSPLLRANELVARGDAQLALQRPDEAKASFQLAQQLAPKAPLPILAEAKLALGRRDLTSAEALFERVLSVDPKSKEALVGKASVMQAKGNGAEALSVLGKAIADWPDYAPARLQRAQILLSQRHIKEATADIDAVLKVQPRNVGAIYMQAVMAAQRGDYQAADGYLQKISGAMGAIQRGYYVQALVQFNLHQFDQAADSAQRYTARNPDDLAGAKLLGLIELTRKHPAQTIDALAKFSAAGKADAGTFDLLGRAYAEVGRTAEAKAAFSQAVKLVPKNSALQLRLAATELRLGDTTDAIQNLQKSLALAPSAPAAEMLVLTDLAAAQWKGAGDAAAQLQKAQPKSPIPDNLLGLIKLAQFDLPAADNEFQAVATKYPDYIPARINLAQTLGLEGKSADAEDILQKILDKEPTNRTALTRLIGLLLRDGKNDAAVADVEKAHNAAPSNVGITSGLIELYLRVGQKDKALTLARQETGENSPATMPLILARAHAEFAAGLKNDALQTYQRLITIEPQRPDLRFQYASALLASGDKQGARRALDEAIKFIPNNPQLINARIEIERMISGFNAALAMATEMQKNNPGLPTAPLLEADTYFGAGYYAQAADIYSRLYQQNPSTTLALRLARAKTASGHTDEATAVLRDWFAKHPKDVAVADVLGGYDVGAHRYDDAVKEFEMVLSQQPRNLVALNDLAWLYQQSKDPRALSYAERAYIIGPNVPQTADTLGWILVQQGQAADAIGLLKQAGAARKTDSTVQYHLAVALNDAGHPKDAIAVLTPLLQGKAKFDDKPAAEKLYAELSKK